MSAQPDEHAQRAQELKEEGEQHLHRAADAGAAKDTDTDEGASDGADDG
jgi:hypothetical protein